MSVSTERKKSFGSDTRSGSSSYWRWLIRYSWMWYCRTAHMWLHQVIYEAVAWASSAQPVWAGQMRFCSITTKYNGTREATHAHIDDDWHELVVLASSYVSSSGHLRSCIFSWLFDTCHFNASLPQLLHWHFLTRFQPFIDFLHDWYMRYEVVRSGKCDMKRVQRE